MRGKVVLITGGTGGIGKQTALALAGLGAQVIVTGRSQASGDAALAEIKQAAGSDNAELMLADLSSQQAIHTLAAEIRTRYPRLDVLINNAGLANPTRELTIDGIEANFAVNVIAPFLLTRLLEDLLEASTSARVVTLAGGNVPQTLDLDNLQGEQSFVGLTAYSQAKLAMMVVMYEYAERLRGRPITVNVCYPGQASTNMTRSVTREMLPKGIRPLYPIFRLLTRPDGGRSATKASQSSVFLASSPAVEGVSGKYYDSKSREAAWPRPVLDAGIRQQVWQSVTWLAAGPASPAPTP